jgi:hypothetical protein
MGFDVSGRWFNQHGSVMDLEVDAAGRIRGSFRSGVGCPDPEETFEVLGFVAGSLIGFTVNFGRYDSITSWAGHCGTEEGQEKIYALWHMSVGIPGGGGPDRLWEAIWSGADTFLRLREAHGRIATPRHPSHPTERR